MRGCSGSRVLTRAGTTALAILLSAKAASAQQRPFTYDEARRVVSVSSPQPSPDGKTVVVIVTRLNFTDNRNESELYAVDAATGKARQLTHQPGGGDAPVVSGWEPNRFHFE